MNQRRLHTAPLRIAMVFAVLLTVTGIHAEEAGWWNKDWTQRQKLTLDASAIGGPAGESTLLVRISDGNVFANAREDGGDIRFVSADGKTLLPHHVESYDSLLGEAYVWVRLPAVSSGTGFVPPIFRQSQRSRAREIHRYLRRRICRDLSLRRTRPAARGCHCQRK